MNSNDDIEIIKLFRDTNTKHYAFNLLVNKYKQQIYFHIRRMVINHDDADDIIQNTFVKIYENLHNFRNDSQLYTWIYRITINEVLAHLKKRRMRLFLPIVNVEKQLENSLKDTSYIGGDEIQLKLQKAILKLPEKQRLIFNMKYFDEMKYEEISEILGTSVGALKASYHIAVKKIEEFIETN